MLRLASGSPALPHPISLGSIPLDQVLPHLVACWNHLGNFEHTAARGSTCKDSGEQPGDWKLSKFSRALGLLCSGCCEPLLQGNFGAGAAAPRHLATSTSRATTRCRGFWIILENKQAPSPYRMQGASPGQNENSAKLSSGGLGALPI